LQRGSVADFIHLEITEKEIADILKEAGFVGYRYDGALKWIVKCIEMIKTPKHQKHQNSLQIP
jgi:hypothetical protein